MILRNALFAISLLSSISAYAGSFQDEEEVALALARANYAQELQAKMHVNYAYTRPHDLLDSNGNSIGYWVSVRVDGKENGGATARYYRVEAANEAGVITTVKLVKTEGPVGP